MSHSFPLQLILKMKRFTVLKASKHLIVTAFVCDCLLNSAGHREIARKCAVCMWVVFIPHKAQRGVELVISSVPCCLL